MKQRQNLACTLIHLLPLFHLFVAAKRSLASNTPLQDHTVLRSWHGVFLAIAVQLSP